MVAQRVLPTSETAPAMRPLLTILIATLDRRDILEKTLWHIYETSTDEERDLWIWDNASQDDTADFLGTMVGWPGVRVFRSKVGLGAGVKGRIKDPALPHEMMPKTENE